MTQDTRKRRLMRASEPGRDPGQPPLISYKALTLGLVLLVALAAFVKLGLPWRRGQSATAALKTSNPSDLTRNDPMPRAKPAEIWSRARSVNSATTTEQSDQPAGDVLSVARALQRLDQVVAQAGSREQQTAAALKRFAASGAMAELRNLDRQDVVSLAEYLAGELAPSEAGVMLQQFLGLPAGSVRTEDEVKSSLVDIYDAVAGDAVEEVRPSVLVITDSADPDGRITGQAHVIPAGTERVYAVFENDHALKGLERVMAVWRNPSDDRMVFTEFEPIRKGSAYNYVWLEVESGWPAGRYRVDLFDPEAQSLLLASESFSVR